MAERTNLVDTEPLIGSSDQSGQVPLDILDIVQLARKWVIDIDDNDLPVSLAFIEECHDSEDFDLLDLADVSELFANLANVERIIVTVSLRLGMHDGGIFPCL